MLNFKWFCIFADFDLILIKRGNADCLLSFYVLWRHNVLFSHMYEFVCFRETVFMILVGFVGYFVVCLRFIRIKMWRGGIWKYSQIFSTFFYFKCFVFFQSAHLKRIYRDNGLENSKQNFSWKYTDAILSVCWTLHSSIWKQHLKTTSYFLCLL